MMYSQKDLLRDALEVDALCENFIRWLRAEHGRDISSLSWKEYVNFSRMYNEQ